MNTKMIFSALKEELKQAHISYKDIALSLNLSESSVKRMFSKEKMPLNTFIKICDLHNIDIGNIINRSNDTLFNQLSEKQESIIAQNDKSILITSCILNGYTLKEIIQEYNLEYTEVLKMAILLDKIKIITLLEQDRIKLNISKTFTWIKDGPIESFFKTHGIADFLNASKATYKFNFSLLNKDDVEEINKSIIDLIINFSQKSTKKTNSSENYGLLIALHPWIPSIFDKYKK